MNRCMFWMKGNSRRVAVYIMTCCVLFFNMPLSVVLAAPQGGVFVPGHGSGTIVDNVQHSTVEVTSPRSIINWTSLDTAGGSDPAVRESLTFSQNAVINAAVLNRVSGAKTQFNGDLTGIGMSIFIVNPAGIMFGEGAAVNVSRLVASTLDIDNGDFMSDNYDFIVPGIGEVANYGTIEADQGAALIAKKVLNNGTIKTGPEGFVVMAAGDRVLLGQPGSKIVVEMSSAAGEVEGAGDVINNGDIEAPGGQIVLAAGDIYSTVAGAGSKAVKVYSGVGTVQQNGAINADSDTGDGGTISLTAADEVVLGPGSETTANAAPDSGGADPRPAGGEIVISSPKNVTASPDARLEAIGNGVLDNDNDGWLEPAEGDADFRGSVEITGTHIVPPLDVDLSAHSGRSDDAGLLSVGPLMGDLYVANDGVPTVPAENTLYEEWIEFMSQQGTNLDLFSYENIYVEHMTDGAIEGGTGDIALRNVFNDNGIEFESPSDGLPTTTVSTSTGGDIFMLAGSGGILAGNIETSVGDHVGDPGRIRLFTNNHGNIETGHLTNDGGNHVEISVISSGDLTIHGDVVSKTHEVPDPEDKTSSAQICLVAGRGVETDTGDVEIVRGDVLIEGSVIVTAHGKGETRSNIHIDAAVGPDQEPDTIGTITIDLGSEGQILAEAKTSGPAPGEQADGTLIAEATIEMHAGAAQAEDGSEAIKIIGGKSGAGQAVQAKADVKGKPGAAFTWEGESLEYSEGTDEYEIHAQIEIESDWGDDPGEHCPDCPPPLWLPPPIDPIGLPDSATTHMGNPVSGNVLDNDVPSQGTVDLAAVLVDEPSHGQLLSFDPETGDYTYLPDEGFVGTDSFTYMAIDSGTSGLISVSIEVTNEAPVANDDSASGHMGSAISDGLDAYDVADIIGDDSFIDDL
ncbi:MAG: filamentous hemagglutinin N-terminal domain-containing protein, partial [Planctomycetota bacterium]